MDCPLCEGKMERVGNSYGNAVLECRECRWVEEIPDRSIPKKPKLKVWRQDKESGR